MDNLTDAQLMGLATDLENQPNQYGLTPEVVGEIIATREWARRFRRRYLGCKAVMRQLVRQIEGEKQAAIKVAYKAAKGATREACALLCEAEGRQHPGAYQEFSNILAELIRAGDGVILSKKEHE